MQKTSLLISILSVVMLIGATLGHGAEMPMIYRSLRCLGICLLFNAVFGFASCQAGDQILRSERVYHRYETSSWLRFADDKNDWVLLLIDVPSRDLKIRTGSLSGFIPFADVSCFTFEPVNDQEGVFKAEFKEGTPTYQQVKIFIFGLLKRNTWDLVVAAHGGDLCFRVMSQDKKD